MLQESTSVSVKIERLDHLGIISQTIKDLGIIELIDQRIPTDSQEHISVGEAVAGMILNGLGFSNRPMSLTPQFFENKPLDLLFRSGVTADQFNRFKLGRSLDDLQRDGCSLLFSEIGLAVCDREQIDLRFNHLDSTSLSVTGEYQVDETEPAAISLRRGYSKDHRPDLKQAVLEMIVSQDGGLPIFMQAWDGNSNDSQIFKERSQALVAQFEAADTPRYLIADSKLYSQDNSVNLARLGYITRIPNSLNLSHQLIEQAWAFNQWQTTPDQRHYQRWELGHYGMNQRWLVVYSETSRQRAEKTVDRAIKRERVQGDKALFHLQAQRFASADQAKHAYEQLDTELAYHQLADSDLIRHPRYAKGGRPNATTPPQDIQWQVQGQIDLDPKRRTAAINHQACYIIGSNIPTEALSDLELLEHYRQQNQVEQGFRFLKDPTFFTAALFVKKPARLQALLMVMTLALLVYAVTERRLRRTLKTQQETLPNQINQPTATPTLRWVFQLLEGIHRVHLFINGQWSILIEGISDLRRRILCLFGPDVCRLYQIFVT
jgi:transposase